MRIHERDEAVLLAIFNLALDPSASGLSEEPASACLVGGRAKPASHVTALSYVAAPCARAAPKHWCEGHGRSGRQAERRGQRQRAEGVTGKHPALRLEVNLFCQALLVYAHLLLVLWWLVACGDHGGVIYQIGQAGQRVSRTRTSAAHWPAHI